MSATSSPPSAVAMAIGASVAGGALGSWMMAVPSRSSTPSASSWRRSVVAEALVVGPAEDVLGDVGDRDVLVGEERLDLTGELDADWTSADDQSAVGCEQRLVGGAVPGAGGGDEGASLPPGDRGQALAAELSTPERWFSYTRARGHRSAQEAGVRADVDHALALDDQRASPLGFSRRPLGTVRGRPLRWTARIAMRGRAARSVTRPLAGCSWSTGCK
jgi:hypothetical protein